MHDVVLIEHLEGLKQLFEDKQRILLWQLALLIEKSLESAAVAEFVDEVEIVGSLEHVIVFDDVGVGLDVGEDIDLVDSALF